MKKMHKVMSLKNLDTPNSRAGLTTQSLRTSRNITPSPLALRSESNLKRLGFAYPADSDRADVLGKGIFRPSKLINNISPVNGSVRQQSFPV